MDATTPPRSKDLAGLVQATKVLVIDDDLYMRKVLRTMLQSVGLKDIHDAANGAEGLDAICTLSPDVVILDWEMPDINGAEFMRIVRSPESFPLHAVPVVMLTGHVGRERVIEAVRLGVHEFLCKPVSAKSLLDRIVSIRAKPRAMIRIGDYYGPEPRKMAHEMPAKAAMPAEVVAAR